MKYGNVELETLQGSTSIVNRKKQEIRHYPGTNQSDVISQGKPPTKISTTLIARNTSEKVVLEQLMHTEGIENKLYYDDRYYQKVTTGSSSKPKPTLGPDNSEIWLIEAEFICLDAVPYDVDTGEALY